MSGFDKSMYYRLRLVLNNPNLGETPARHEMFSRAVRRMASSNSALLKR
jgi:hypothetical protein